MEVEGLKSLMTKLEMVTAAELPGVHARKERGICYHIGLQTTLVYIPRQIYKLPQIKVYSTLR